MAGAITELKPAVTAVLRTTPVAAFAGDTAITAGSAGLGACSLPHPATANNKNAPNTFPTASVRISVSYSRSETMQDPYQSKPAIQKRFQWNQDPQNVDSKGMTVGFVNALKEGGFTSPIELVPNWNEINSILEFRTV